MTYVMAPNEDAVVDWTAVLSQFDGRQEFVTKLAGIALKAYADLPEKITQAIGEHNLPNLGQLAHNVKGICANFRAPTVLAQALATETSAKDGHAALALPCAKKLVPLVYALIDDIADWRQAHAGDSPRSSPAGGVGNRQAGLDAGPLQTPFNTKPG